MAPPSVSVSPNLHSVCNPGIRLHSSELQDFGLKIFSTRGGSQKAEGASKAAASDPESSIAHWEARLYPVNIRNADVNDTRETQTGEERRNALTPDGLNMAKFEECKVASGCSRRISK